jgi:tetratricopeptide (TPR) repeat protein
MTSAIEIFCCYSRKDQELLENLKAHLAPLRRQGLINIWNDTDISPGTDYEDEINKHLDSANIILLLVSPDFMNSDYCYSTEMERAMERHNKGESCVVPIILRPVLFKDAPFGKIQALPTDAKPVKRWADPDDAFFDVAAGIQKIAEELRLKQYLSEALSLFDTDQFTEALHMYEKALRLSPTSIEALWGKGETLRKLERYAE